MKTVLISAYLGCALCGSAQITIVQNDMPDEGDSYGISMEANLTAIDPEQTGPNFTWDFSSLTASGGHREDDYVAVSSTPIAYQFYFNNFVLYPDHDADHALAGEDIDFQQVTITDVYNYYKNDPTDYKHVGFGSEINSVPASTRNIPIDYIYRFPMDYGNMDTSVSAFGLTIPTLGYYGQDKTRMNEVDGWGTVTTPEGTYDVLRIKSTIDAIDTLYVDQFSTGISVPRPTAVEYKWLANGEGVPVVTVITNIVQSTETVQSIEFRDEIPLGVKQVPLSSLGVFPNPSNGMFLISSKEKGSFTISDFSGRQVATGQLNKELDLSNQPSGIYFVRCESSTIKLVLTNY